MQDVHLKPQLQLSAGQNTNITTVTNHIDEKVKSTTPASTDSAKSQSNMEGASEPYTNGNTSVSSASNAPKQNGAEDEDVNLESEERDEFIDIKVSLAVILTTT